MEVLDDCERGVRDLVLNKWQERLLHLALKSNHGSDESSIAGCFFSFVEGYCYSTREQFVWDWLKYHQHHQGTGYGRTMRDHFSLVAHIRRHGDKYPDLNGKIKKLAEMAADADSFGNACLALMYPAYCYAKTIDEDPSEFVPYMTGFTHSHPAAMEAMSRRCLFIENPETILISIETAEQKMMRSFGRGSVAAMRRPCSCINSGRSFTGYRPYNVCWNLKNYRDSSSRNEKRGGRHGSKIQRRKS